MGFTGSSSYCGWRATTNLFSNQTWSHTILKNLDSVSLAAGAFIENKAALSPLPLEILVHTARHQHLWNFVCCILSVPLSRASWSCVHSYWLHFGHNVWCFEKRHALMQRTTIPFIQSQSAVLHSITQNSPREARLQATTAWGETVGTVSRYTQHLVSFPPVHKMLGWLLRFCKQVKTQTFPTTMAMTKQECENYVECSHCKCVFLLDSQPAGQSVRQPASRSISQTVSQPASHPATQPPSQTDRQTDRWMDKT